MRALTLPLGLAVAISAAASAQEPSITPPGGSGVPCFEVAMLSQPGAPVGSILLNKCTGATWQLTREGDTQKAFTYRWHPIRVETTEAILSFASPLLSSGQKVK
jgi:hypothetical protein